MAGVTKDVVLAWTLKAAVPLLLAPKQHQEANMNAYMCYFDTVGFEWIFNVTEYDSKLIGTFGGPAINVNTGIQVQIQGDFNINL